MNSTKIAIQSQINLEKSNDRDLYTHPDYIVHWNFASDDWHCPNATNNFRVGGKYLARMEAKEGSFRLDFEAV